MTSQILVIKIDCLRTVPDTQKCSVNHIDNKNDHYDFPLIFLAALGLYCYVPALSHFSQPGLCCGLAWWSPLVAERRL